jgi:hypothetical protein
MPRYQRRANGSSLPMQSICPSFQVSGTNAPPRELHKLDGRCEYGQHFWINLQSGKMCRRSSLTDRTEFRLPFDFRSNEL